MTNSYLELFDIKYKCEQRYEKLMWDYYKLQNEIVNKEIAILNKKCRECEYKIFTLEHEFIFS